VDLLAAPAERIRVVPPVHVDPGVAATPSPGRPYLIYPAVSHPHKRHVDAVRALHLLAPAHPDLDLVLTGAPGGAADDLERTIAELDLTNRVRILGRVSAADLDHLLRGATAMVFPSVYEGFGNPVIEAMSRRVPVIAAEAASLPEVAGGAALLFEPRSPRALAARVHELLTDPLLAHRLIAAGVDRAADFRAEVAAGALLGAYGGALA
jgi:glycosyltransferase involved in cell wall biosynthesis